MYYYGNSYGYGNTCGQPAPVCCGSGSYGAGNGYAIILVLFILLIIILSARSFNN